MSDTHTFPVRVVPHSDECNHDAVVMHGDTLVVCASQMPLYAELRQAVDALRAARIRYGLEEVHLSVYDWQRFERAIDRLGSE